MKPKDGGNTSVSCSVLRWWIPCSETLLHPGALVCFGILMCAAVTEMPDHGEALMTILFDWVLHWLLSVMSIFSCFTWVLALILRMSWVVKASICVQTLIGAKAVWPVWVPTCWENLLLPVCKLRWSVRCCSLPAWLRVGIPTHAASTKRWSVSML